MLIAHNEHGRRTTPTPNTAGHCPICHAPVHTKCGKIVSWHWAHKNLIDCDTWAEPDSAWHKGWQEYAPLDRREIVIGNHRADIVTTNGVIVELQHSHLAPDEITDRENHYGNMIWLFDARDAYKAERLLIRPRPSKGENYATFRWKHPRKSVARCKRPVFLDIGYNKVLHLKRIHTAAPCGGWGYLRPHTAFINYITKPAAVGGAA